MNVTGCVAVVLYAACLLYGKALLQNTSHFWTSKEQFSAPHQWGEGICNVLSVAVKNITYTYTVMHCNGERNYILGSSNIRL